MNDTSVWCQNPSVTEPQRDAPAKRVRGLLNLSALYNPLSHLAVTALPKGEPFFGCGGSFNLSACMAGERASSPKITQIKLPNFLMRSWAKCGGYFRIFESFWLTSPQGSSSAMSMNRGTYRPDSFRPSSPEASLPLRDRRSKRRCRRDGGGRSCGQREHRLRARKP